MRNFVQTGISIGHTPNGEALTSGVPVLIGTVLGIPVTDIPDGATGALQIQGVFEVPKASEAIAQGAKLYWDEAAANATTASAGNTPCGVAVAAALESDLTVELHLNFGS